MLHYLHAKASHALTATHQSEDEPVFKYEVVFFI